MVAVGEEIRKGPWTEQEDLQLVWFVSLFGERRWDFIAKVSGLSGGGGYYVGNSGGGAFSLTLVDTCVAGLKRTGKSCRLRWFNYLHPGLKHGRMSPQEERLVLELHAEWGNRFPSTELNLIAGDGWSRIARRLPGRTDNEIKNYWRTHMRKMAQERRRCSSGFLPIHSELPFNATPFVKEAVARENEDEVKTYPMEQIWNDIGCSGSAGGSCFEQCLDESSSEPCGPPPLSSPFHDQFADYQWMVDDAEVRFN